ncbi:MAG: type II toxin-antitoxin system VapC family toxin [Solirubrobacteraceae bacterium]
MSRRVYLDSSAIVKLVVSESESDALTGFLRGAAVGASCALARVEVLRAVAVQGPDAADRARRVLANLELIRLDDVLLDAAGMLGIAGLRSLDAIHVTAARQLGHDLECLVTYDRRMGAAAEALGLAVARPA